MAKKSKRGIQGCRNCMYSSESKDGEYHCGKKAGSHKIISEDDWFKTNCKKWFYDGFSEGFDPDEEYEIALDTIV